MDTNKIYYVYLHRRLTDDKVFYVGKGKETRAWVKKARNNHWHNVVNKHGYYVQIIKSDMDEAESFDLESRIILHYGLENLTNQTIGGHTSTGYRHTPETIKLQQEIGRKRLVDNPELHEKLLTRLAKLHEKQRYDLEYKKEMSRRSKEAYAALSEEEKEAVRQKKRDVCTAEHREKSSLRMKKRFADDPELASRLSKATSDWWAQEDNPTVIRRRKECADMLRSEEVRRKVLEAQQKPVVINRTLLVDSVGALDTIFNTTHTAGNSLKNAVRNGYIGTLFRGYLLEYYNPEIHNSLSKQAEVIAYPFLALPLKFGVMMDDYQVFLSPYVAARYLGREGSRVGTTGDWLSVKARNGEYSLGHQWRVATTEEINSYIEEIFNKGAYE